MADEAGLYEALWRPYKLKKNYDIIEDDYNNEYEFENSNPVKANEIISIIEKGLKDMKAKPSYYKKFDSLNGWGLYVHFIPFIEEYLEALKKYPDAFVECSR